MNKYIKYMAIAAIAAVGISAQAKAASVSLNLSNGISISISDGNISQVKHKAEHDKRDKHHISDCRDCAHKADRRAKESRQAHSKRHK